MNSAKEYADKSINIRRRRVAALIHLDLLSVRFPQSKHKNPLFQ